MIESSAPLSPGSSSGAGAAYAESRWGGGGVGGARAGRCHVRPDASPVRPDGDPGGPAEPTGQGPRPGHIINYIEEDGSVRQGQCNGREKQVVGLPLSPLICLGAVFHRATALPCFGSRGS